MHLLNTKPSAKDADKNKNWQWVVIMVSSKKKSLLLKLINEEVWKWDNQWWSMIRRYETFIFCTILGTKTLTNQLKSGWRGAELPASTLSAFFSVYPMHQAFTFTNVSCLFRPFCAAWLFTWTSLVKYVFPRASKLHPEYILTNLRATHSVAG